MLVAAPLPAPACVPHLIAEGWRAEDSSVWPRRPAPGDLAANAARAGNPISRRRAVVASVATAPIVVLGGVFAGSVKETDGGKPKRFRYEVRPDDRRLTITFNDPASGPRFDGSYEFPDDRTLKLTGNLGEDRVEVLLARQR